MVSASKNNVISVFTHNAATIKLTRYSYRGDRSSEVRLSTPTDAHASQTFSRPKNPTPSGGCERADNIVASAGIHNVSFLKMKKLTSKSILRGYPHVELERNSSSTPRGERK
jgi:hypothetical protein